MSRLKKGNSRKKRKTPIKGLIPMSSEQVLTKLNELRNSSEEAGDNVVMLLDHLGRKKPEYQPERRVTVLEDHVLKIPELWLNVYIHGPEAGPSFNKFFARAKCFKSDAPDDADLVVFTGSGHDIDPMLYGQRKHETTCLNVAMDKANIQLYHFCAKRGIPMFGVCGGAQILHVMNNGALYQDVDGHDRPHSMWDIPGKQNIDRISSVHHQMCMDNKENGMEVLAVSHTSRDRWVNGMECDHGSNHDIEAFFYRDTCCLGVQGHPEYAGYNKYSVWCLQQIDHCMNENPDLSYRANDAGCNHLRVKQELIDERGAKRPVITVAPPLIIEAKG